MVSPGVEIPPWYGVRWHFLPDGYLSRRSLGLYDALIPTLYNQGMGGRVARAIARVLQEAGARRVLHAGCGTGRILAGLASRVTAAQLTGIDLSPFALERADRRLAGLQHRVILRQADAAALPFAEGAFDAVVLTHLLGHVPADVAADVLTEARRVLAPGGHMVSLDHSWHPRVPMPAGLQPGRARQLLGGLGALTVATGLATWQTGAQDRTRGQA